MGKAEVEITMDSTVYETAKGLLLLEDLRTVLELLGYPYENYVTGEGFEIFLELGIAHFIMNRTALEEKF